MANGIYTFIDRQTKFDDFFDYWGKYPPSYAIPILAEAISTYLSKRFPGSEKIVEKKPIDRARSINGIVVRAAY